MADMCLAKVVEGVNDEREGGRSYCLVEGGREGSEVEGRR